MHFTVRHCASRWRQRNAPPPTPRLGSSSKRLLNSDWQKDYVQVGEPRLDIARAGERRWRPNVSFSQVTQASSSPWRQLRSQNPRGQSAGGAQRGQSAGDSGASGSPGARSLTPVRMDYALKAGTGPRAGGTVPVDRTPRPTARRIGARGISLSEPVERLPSSVTFDRLRPSAPKPTWARAAPMPGRRRRCKCALTARAQRLGGAREGTAGRLAHSCPAVGAPGCPSTGRLGSKDLLHHRAFGSFNNLQNILYLSVAR